jgi:hypothetical protein
VRPLVLEHLGHAELAVLGMRTSLHSDRQRSASQALSSAKEPKRCRPASIQMRLTAVLHVLLDAPLLPA